MSSQYNTFPFKTRNSPYCFVKIRSGAFACLISLATRKESASRAVSSTMAHGAMRSKCDPSTNPWVFCTEWGPYWGALPLKIRVSKDLEGTLNLSRTLPGTAVSTGSQVMSNCDRGLSCVRITCRVQQTRARSSAAATTKKTQTRAEANILKTRHSESAMPKQACANFRRALHKLGQQFVNSSTASSVSKIAPKPSKCCACSPSKHCACG